VLRGISKLPKKRFSSYLTCFPSCMLTNICLSKSEIIIIVYELINSSLVKLVLLSASRGKISTSFHLGEPPSSTFVRLVIANFSWYYTFTSTKVSTWAVFIKSFLSRIITFGPTSSRSPSSSPSYIMASCPPLAAFGIFGVALRILLCIVVPACRLWLGLSAYLNSSIISVLIGTFSPLMQ
jgi:hypothetical protein